MTWWYAAEQRKAREAEQKLADRVERGTLKPETAAKKASEIVAPESHAKTETATATMSSVTKWRVVDKSKIPLEFLVEDWVKIKASFKTGTPVAGVEEYKENQLAIS